MNESCTNDFMKIAAISIVNFPVNESVDLFNALNLLLYHRPGFQSGFLNPKRAGQAEGGDFSSEANTWKRLLRHFAVEP